MPAVSRWNEKSSRTRRFTDFKVFCRNVIAAFFIEAPIPVEREMERGVEERKRERDRGSGERWMRKEGFLGSSSHRKAAYILSTAQCGRYTCGLRVLSPSLPPTLLPSHHLLPLHTSFFPFFSLLRTVGQYLVFLNVFRISSDSLLPVCPTDKEFSRNLYISQTLIVSNFIR